MTRQLPNPLNALAAVGRVIGDGMTLAAEILCPRDHTAEDRLRSWESASVAVEDEICDEAEACDEALYCVENSCPGGNCPCEISAADTAADPSPADNHHASRGAGDEGRKEDSCIPPPASFRQPTCIRCDQRIGEAALVADKGGYWCSVTCAQLDQESDPGAVTSPSPGDGRPTSELLMDASVRITADTRDDFALITELRERAEMFRGIEADDA